MPVNRGSIAQLLDPRYRKLFIDVGKERPLEYTTFLNTGPMPYAPMTDFQVSGLGTMPAKGEGSEYARDEAIAGGSVTWDASEWGLAFEVTQSAWEDDLYGMHSEMSAEMGRAVRNRKEVNAFAPVNDAFAAATFTGYDGLGLCSTAHTRLDGGAVQANRPSPDVGFSKTAIQAARLAFHRQKNERGFDDVRFPSTFILDAINLDVAREILGSSGKPYVADNEINSVVQDGFTYQIVHKLTTATHWHLIASKGSHDVWYMERIPESFDSFDDMWTGNGVFTCRLRDSSGFGSYKGWYGSTG